MIWENIILALREIRRNVLRSVLTILGIVIGVAAVITMVTLGSGATEQVTADIAKLGSKIFMVAYGSGAGSDAFSITVEDAMEERRGEVPTVDDYIERKTYVDYAINAKYRRKIKE